MSQRRLAAYQIEVLDFSKKSGRRHNDAVVPDGRGIFRCSDCGWEGSHNDKCPQCKGKKIQPKGRIKLIDMLPIAPRRTLVELFYGHKQAMRWGSRFGTVISCEKVDKERYLQNIEQLNLEQEPVSIEIEQDYVLTKTLELERPRRTYQEKEINVEIVDKNP